MKTIAVEGLDTPVGQGVEERLAREPEVRPGRDADVVIDAAGLIVRTADRVARLEVNLIDAAPRALRLPLVPVPLSDRPVQLVHPDDVADALVRAARRGADGVFTLGTDEPLRRGAIARAVGARGLPLPDPAWLRGLDGVRDPARARRELGWRPRWPTTGAVLRGLVDRPAIRASRGTLALLGAMAAVTRVRGALPVPGRVAASLAGLSGTINWTLSGERPSEWRIVLGDGRLGLRVGLAGDAVASTTMADRTFHDVLSGTLPWPRATMTGRVRITGDPGYALVVGGVVNGLRLILSRWPRGAAALLGAREVTA